MICNHEQTNPATRSLILLAAVFLAACTSAPQAQITPAPDGEGKLPATLTSTPSKVLLPTSEPRTQQPYVPPQDGFTHLRVDGDPADWATYPAVWTDPKGDSMGDPDLLDVFAFRNDVFLYIMLTFDGAVGLETSLQVRINPADPYFFDVNLLTPEFHNFSSQNPGHAEQGRLEFDLSVQNGIELRLPLDAFLGPQPEQISISLMEPAADGGMRTVDEFKQAQILAVPEMQPAFITEADLVAQDSSFCQESSLVRKAAWTPVDGASLPAGFQAEYFIAPTGLQVPSDVVALPDGGCLVSSSWMAQMIAVSEEGQVQPWGQNHGSYAVDRDDSGQVYGYNSPVGVIVRVVPGADPLVLLKDESIRTLNESPMTVSPEGTIYVAPNKFFDGETPDGSYIVELKGGQARRLATTYTGMVSGLDFGRDGQLYASIANELFVLDLETGAQSLIATLPGHSSFHGLDVDAGGEAYVVVAEKKDWSSLYRVNSSGDLSLFAELEGEPIEGIAISSDGSVVGAQRNTGGLWRFLPDGGVQVVVEPNDLVTPETMAFTPCGELLVVLEEGGTMGVFAPDGGLTGRFSGRTFAGPHILSMSPNGWFTVNLGMPPMPELWFDVLLPNGRHTTLSEDVDVRGAVIHPDGEILVTAARERAILRYQPDGSHEILREGLESPSSLVESADGTLYFIEREHDVVSLSQEGELQRIATFILEPLLLAMGPDGNLYVSFYNDASIVQITPDGRQQRLVSGVGKPYGLAFDVAGNLYISDSRSASIVRVSGLESHALTGTLIAAGTGEPLGEARLILSQSAYPYAGTMLTTDEQGAFAARLVSGKYAIRVLQEDAVVAELDQVEVTADTDIGVIEVELAGE